MTRPFNFPPVSFRKSPAMQCSLRRPLRELEPRGRSEAGGIETRRRAAGHILQENLRIVVVWVQNEQLGPVTRPAAACASSSHEISPEGGFQQHVDVLLNRTALAQL